MRLERIAEVLNADVSRETFDQLKTYVELLIEENDRQNLISKNSVADLEERHIVDSAQLLPLAGRAESSWVDIGTGPGLPGIVLAILAPESRFTLVEPRALRISFLHQAVERLRLGDRVTVAQAKAADIAGKFDVITGRAVANLAKFLRISQHLSTEKTVWVLPKGRKAADELEEARRFWQFEWCIVPSVTDSEAGIVRIEKVRAKTRGGRR